MMHVYSTLLCIAVHPKHFTIIHLAHESEGARAPSLWMGMTPLYPSTAATTVYVNAPYPMTETHILKDKTVNLAYRMYWMSCSPQIKMLSHLEDAALISS